MSEDTKRGPCSCPLLLDPVMQYTHHRYSAVGEGGTGGLPEKGARGSRGSVGWRGWIRYRPVEVRSPVRASPLNSAILYIMGNL